VHPTMMLFALCIFLFVFFYAPIADQLLLHRHVSLHDIFPPVVATRNVPAMGMDCIRNDWMCRNRKGSMLQKILVHEQRVSW